MAGRAVEVSGKIGESRSLARLEEAGGVRNDSGVGGGGAYLIFSINTHGSWR